MEYFTFPLIPWSNDGLKVGARQIRPRHRIENKEGNKSEEIGQVSFAATNERGDGGRDVGATWARRVA